MNQLLRTLARVDFYLRWYVAQVGAGRHPSRFRGAGLEFEKITRYDLGDDPRWINWAATARSGGMRVLKNSLIEERQLQVVLAVDLSASMDFGTRRASKRTVAAEIAAVVAHVAWRAGDLLGFIGYAGTVEDRWAPRYAARDRLLVAATILDARAGAGGPAAFSTALGSLPRKRSLVFVLSDFHEDPATLAPAVRVAARHHDLVPVVIQDPRERSLPEGTGLVDLRDLETGARRTIWLDHRSREAWTERLRRRDQALDALFADSGVEPVRLDAAADPSTDVAKLFLRRRRTRRWGDG